MPDLNAYPHGVSCPECRRERRCNHCGAETGYPCTNGRCSACHLDVCTPGGITTPGHGSGLPPGAGARHYVERRKRVVTCSTCQAGDEPIPWHDASDRCESGKRTHCACDTCF